MDLECGDRARFAFTAGILLRMAAMAHTRLVPGALMALIWNA
jgi:hypothetical protein